MGKENGMSAARRWFVVALVVVLSLSLATVAFAKSGAFKPKPKMLLGEWILHFSWDGGSTYGQTSWTFFKDGTVAIGDYGPGGTWRGSAEFASVQYNSSPTLYLGRLLSETHMEGFMAGGLWYADKVIAAPPGGVIGNQASGDLTSAGPSQE